MFHVERQQNGICAYLERAKEQNRRNLQITASFRPYRRHADICFFVPTKMYLCSDCGIGIGSFHSHNLDLRASSRSRPPIHSATCFALTCGEAAHSKKRPNSPTALEQTVSSGATSSPSSSYRLMSTRVSLSPNSRATSARKVPFLIFDSTSTNSNSGRAILSGTPGNPAPEPMSASRPLSTGIAPAPNMDSQK